MADSRHIENRLLAIYPRVIVRLRRYLVRSSRTMLRHTPRDENSNFRKFKMADGRHFENGFITYIPAANHPISMKFGVPLRILVLRTVTWQSTKILQIQNGGRSAYWKSFFGYISTNDYPINAKFCRMKQNHVLTQDMTKIPNFENSRWRTAAILKIVLSLYLSRKSSNFNEIWCADAYYDSKVGYLTKYQNLSNSIWRTAAILKIVFWLYLEEWLSD